MNLILYHRRKAFRNADISPIDPQKTPDLWLDAVTLGLSQGESVSTWTGRVGSASANGGTGTYLSAGMGGKPAVSFSANRRLVSTVTGVSTCNNLQVFLVLQTPVSAASDTNTLYAFGVGDYATVKVVVLASATGFVTGESIVFSYKSPAISEGRLGSSSYTRAANTPHLLFSENNTSGTRLRANGTDVTLNLSSGGMTTSTNTAPSSLSYTGGDELIIGSFRQTNIQPNPAFVLAEALVYVDKNLNNTQIGNIESQIIAKWGI